MKKNRAQKVEEYYISQLKNLGSVSNRKWLSAPQNRSRKQKPITINIENLIGKLTIISNGNDNEKITNEITNTIVESLIKAVNDVSQKARYNDVNVNPSTNYQHLIDSIQFPPLSATSHNDRSKSDECSKRSGVYSPLFSHKPQDTTTQSESNDHIHSISVRYNDRTLFRIEIPTEPNPKAARTGQGISPFAGRY